MRDDMALPAVQRDALIERMVQHIRKGYVDEMRQQEARAALAAIEEQYVLVPRDKKAGCHDCPPSGVCNGRCMQ